MQKPSKFALIYPRINLNETFNREYLNNSGKMQRYPWRVAKEYSGFGRQTAFDKNNVIYELTLRTGKSATHANVYAKLIGRFGVVNKQRLNVNQYPAHSTRICQIVGPEIGDIKSVLLETDAFDENDCWYINDVIIENCRTSQTWYVSCNTWLSLWRGDGRVTKYFTAKNYRRSPQLTEINFVDYEITTQTGKFPTAGTSSNIYVTFYGNDLITPKIHLVCTDGDCFRGGKTDKFLVRAPNVGDLVQIKVEQDCSGNSPSWYLEKVIVINVDISKTFIFSCNSWLDINSTFKYLDLSDKETVDNYKVSIFTGNQIDAGTDSKIFITLFGLYGDSGENQLQSGSNNFQRGSVNHFYLTTNKVGSLKRIKIRHDNSGCNPSWFLDKIIVENTGNFEKFYFPCQRWLSDNRDDGRIERYLILQTPHNSESFQMVLYKIKITTGNILNAKTTSSVFIILFGGTGGYESSGKIWLKGGKFQRGSTDVFDIEVPVLLSPLSKIIIGHDNSGSEPAWFLSMVSVFCLESGIEQFFPCNKWLARDEGDGLIERELREDVVVQKCRKKVIPWVISVFTGSGIDSVVNCIVKIVLYGTRGKSDELILRNELLNRLQTNQVDRFQFATKDVGIPRKIRISKIETETSSLSSWFLEKIEFCNKLTMQTYLFSCYRWFSRTEEDGRTIREIPAEGPGIYNPLRVVQYSVVVYTGNKFSAGGTDADILINIYGDLGDCGDRLLQEQAVRGSNFLPGGVDEFILEAVNLGKLEKIRVKHQRVRSHGGWYLEKIIIRRVEFDSETVFWFDSWINNEERIIYPLST